MPTTWLAFTAWLPVACLGAAAIVSCALQTECPEEELDEDEDEVYGRGGPPTWHNPSSPQPLDPDLVRAIPCVPYHETRNRACGMDQRTCAVCLDAFDCHANVRELPLCLHVFHAECIDSWFQGHSTCPICRHDVASYSPPTAHSKDILATSNLNRCSSVCRLRVAA